MELNRKDLCRIVGALGAKRAELIELSLERDRATADAFITEASAVRALMWRVRCEIVTMDQKQLEKDLETELAR